MHRYPLSVLFLSQVVVAREPQIAAEHQEHETAQPCHGDHAAQLHHAGDDQRVLVPSADRSDSSRSECWRPASRSCCRRPRPARAECPWASTPRRGSTARACRRSSRSRSSWHARTASACRPARARARSRSRPPCVTASIAGLLAGEEVPARSGLRTAVALHVEAPSSSRPVCGVSLGSMLMTMMLKSLPGVSCTISSALVRPSSSSEQSIGQL